MRIVHNLKPDNKRTLGNYRSTLSYQYQEIEICLPFTLEYTKRHGKMEYWNDIYSHIISHEIIHAVLHRDIGYSATCDFDNIAGKVDITDIQQVGIGMDKMSKRQNTNKGLNSRTNK